MQTSGFILGNVVQEWCFPANKATSECSAIMSTFEALSNYSSVKLESVEGRTS